MKIEVGDHVVLTESSSFYGDYWGVVWRVVEAYDTPVGPVFCLKSIHEETPIIAKEDALEHVQEGWTLDEASLRIENDRLQKSQDEYKEAYNEILKDNERLRDICKREGERADRAERNLNGLKKPYNELLEDYKEKCKYYESMRVQLVSLRDKETERNKELLRGIYRALYSAEPERDSELIWNALREEIEVTKKNEQDFMKLYKRQSEKKAFEDLSEDNELRSQLGESQVEITDLRCALGHWKEAARLAEQELDERDKQVDKLKDELRNKQFDRDHWKSRAIEAEGEMDNLEERLRLFS